MGQMLRVECRGSRDRLDEGIYLYAKGTLTNALLLKLMLIRHIDHTGLGS